MRGYFETNFVMGAATGRDANASRFLALASSRVRFCLPEVCIMEAFSALEDEQKRRNRFNNDVSQQISELSRNTASTYAPLLRGILEGAQDRNVDYLNEVKARMQEIIAQLLGQRPPLAGAELLSVQAAYSVPDVFIQTGLPPEIRNQPTDTLILCVICADALHYPSEPKAFLSGNTRDFNNDEVREFLALCGVRYFSTTESLLGWLDSGGPDSFPIASG